MDFLTRPVTNGLWACPTAAWTRNHSNMIRTFCTTTSPYLLQQYQRINTSAHYAKVSPQRTLQPLSKSSNQLLLYIFILGSSTMSIDSKNHDYSLDAINIFLFLVQLLSRLGFAAFFILSWYQSNGSLLGIAIGLHKKHYNDLYCITFILHLPVSYSRSSIHLVGDLFTLCL